MVDTTDLKSVDLNSREGSSPSTPKFKKLMKKNKVPEAYPVRPYYSKAILSTLCYP